MKKYFLIIGILLFFIGSFTKLKFFIAAGIILIIVSFWGEVLKGKEKKEKKIQKPMKFSSKGKCPNCGAELLQEDNYCPECGKKILP